MRLLTFALLFLSAQCFAQTKPQIKVTNIDKGFYVYTSYGMYNGGLVPANGLLYQSTDGIVLVDTPWDIDQTKQLLNWIDSNLNQPILFCVHTHAHADRVAGDTVLRAKNIKTYSSIATNTKAVAAGYPKAVQTFVGDTTLFASTTPVEVFYPGPGHTTDNEVVWFPLQKILFGGCFVKSTDDTDLGYTGEADLKQWPASLQKVIARYPDAKIVIPGHDGWADKTSMQHTLQLLVNKNAQP